MFKLGYNGTQSMRIYLLHLGTILLVNEKLDFSFKTCKISDYKTTRFEGYN